MQLPPGSAAGRAVLFDQPFAGSAELQTGAVHQQMQRAGSGSPERRHLQRLGPAAQRGMVRHREIKSEQSDDGADQPLGLPQPQAKDHAHRQGRGDRQGRVVRLAAWRGSRLRPPRLDRLVGKPHGQAAPPLQRSVILRPVRDPIAGLRDVMAVFSVVFERQGGATPRVNGRCDVGCRPSVCNHGVSLQQSRATSMTVTVDSTFVRSCEGGEQHLEVRVGNVETSDGGRQVFGAVARSETDIAVRIRRCLDAVGRTAETAVTAFTDGCEVDPIGWTGIGVT